VVKGTSTTVRVLAYQRVSTRKQGFDRQELDARQFCELNGFELGDMFQEKVSGYTPPWFRKEFLRLSAAVDMGQGDLVFFSELDRFSRQSWVWERIHHSKLLPCPLVFERENYCTNSDLPIIYLPRDPRAWAAA
jgi:DNA invertase Pin-like site-specific DNA recombinase